MPQIIATDPGSTEVQSPLIAGLSEGLSKISNILNLQVGELEDDELENVIISDTDKNRIYQAVSGHRLWLNNPTPIFKKNGEIISQEVDGFNVDYVGGSITFIGNMVLQDNDVVTVSCSYITANSKTLYDMQTLISGTAQHSDKYKGAFNTLDELESNVNSPKNGDYAIILSLPAFYAWKDTEWKNTQSIEDLSNFYNKEETNALLQQKEPTITPKTGNDANDYYYSGNKTWLSIREKVRNTVLTGLDIATNIAIEATDTVLSALGKLQAQLTNLANKSPLTGTSDPTTETQGNIGQRYINTSNGKWWTLKDITVVSNDESEETRTEYVWVEGAYTASKLTTARNISVSDSDRSNVGESTAFDGSENVTLKLPSKIKGNFESVTVLTDLNDTSNFGIGVHLSRWVTESLNTPFKQGISIYGLGFVITLKADDNWSQQVSYTVHNTGPWIRYYESGVWSAWTGINAAYATSAGSAVDNTARDTAQAAMPKAGGTFTGSVQAVSTYSPHWQVRNNFIVTASGFETNQPCVGIYFYRK